MKYTKPELEKLVREQLEVLNSQREYIRLLKEQNEHLLKQNHKLMNELTDEQKRPRP